MLHKMAARTLFSCGYREIPSFPALIKFTPHSIDYDVSKRCSHVATKTEDLETKEYSALVKFAWLGQLAQGISVKGGNVKVYTEPEDYYELVKERVSTACSRVQMASLYLGTGGLEQALAQEVSTALERKKELRCQLLLDHLRGTRGSPNSCSILQPIIRRYHPRASLSLYHTPNFRGLQKKLFPERFNEGMGLQHMKFFVIDNNVIITGANLSNSYFTNRQDRCIEFQESSELADFFSAVLETVCHHSFTLEPDSTITPPPIGIHPLKSSTSSAEFKQSLRTAVEGLVYPPSSEMVPVDTQTSISKRGGPLYDTVVYPLVQMGQVGVLQDQRATERLLHSLEADSTTYLASGYFNMPASYTDIVLQSPGRWNILAASPQANGFYGAGGIAGHVPSMYIHFAKKFLKSIDQSHRHECIQYLEYFKSGWTFHGKGLWHYRPLESLPSLVLAGSSNFGYRSLLHDLEAQVAIVTDNVELKKAFHSECKHLFDCAAHVGMESVSDPDRQLHPWEWVVTNILSRRV